MVTSRYSSSTCNFRACAQALPQYTALEIFIDKKCNPRMQIQWHMPLFM